VLVHRLEMKTMKRIIVALAIVATAVAGNSLSPNSAKADPAGVWAHVCCGDQCGGYDYCIGDGPYDCCKGGVD
jgi:hypothetical protein